MSLLKVSDLVTAYEARRGTVHAVNGVSFEVSEGEMVGIVGETGCGKSATVRSIVGLIRPPGRVVGGSATLDGQDLLQMRPRELRSIRGVEIGYVTQNPFASLNPILTIGEQFANVVRAHRSVTRLELRELALARLRSVGIGGSERVLRGHAHELSGGMAQRVVLAIAMALDPRLLIADEPTTALDVTVQRQILDLMRSLLSDRRGILLVTHDLGVVAQYCDSVVVMYAGKVVERGGVREVFRAPRHPYTAALLAAVPRAGKQLVGLAGSVPDLVTYPAGCPYRFRCPRAAERCAEVAPELTRTAIGTEVSCHFPLKEEAVDVATG